MLLLSPIGSKVTDLQKGRDQIINLKQLIHFFQIYSSIYWDNEHRYLLLYQEMFDLQERVFLPL